MTHTVDTFQETLLTNLESHTPDSGGPWVRTQGGAGSMQVIGGHVNWAANAGGVGAWTVDTGGVNHYARVTLGSDVAWRGGGAAYPIARASDGNNCFFILSNTNTTVLLRKNNAGTQTTLITASGVTIANGDVWGLEVQATNTFNITQNGATIGSSATDSFNSTATLTGFRYPGSATLASLATGFESDAVGGASFQPAWAIQSTSVLGGGYPNV